MLVVFEGEKGNILGVSALRLVVKQEVAESGALVHLPLIACLVLLAELKVGLLLLVRELTPKLADELSALSDVVVGLLLGDPLAILN